MKLKLKSKIKKSPTGTQATGSTSRQITEPAMVARVSTAPAGCADHQITTESIAFYAYNIWEQEGRPQGRELEHWLQAESHIKQIARTVPA